jgi:hypothetical protein
MEFWQGWSCTGCRLTPLVSIQNPGPEKCQEVRERELSFFQCSEKNTVPDMRGNGERKKHSPTTLGLCFFFTAFLPHVWDCFFSEHWKKQSSLSLTSWHFSGPGFWLVTKGVKQHPVQGQPCHNFISVLGMEQPRPGPGQYMSQYICPSSEHKFILDFLKIPGYFRGIQKPWSISQWIKVMKVLLPPLLSSNSGEGGGLVSRLRGLSP